MFFLQIHIVYIPSVCVGALTFSYKTGKGRRKHTSSSEGHTRIRLYGCVNMKLALLNINIGWSPLYLSYISNSFSAEYLHSIFTAPKYILGIYIYIAATDRSPLTSMRTASSILTVASPGLSQSHVQEIRLQNIS